MLWVGWYGFNAGSAGAADGIAANAFATTTLATAVASFTWGMVEYILKGKPSVLGFSTGAVAGLVCITPACGFVDSTGAVIIGVLAALVPYWACVKLKKALGYDDALDAFGVHGIGGTWGAIATGLFASKAVNPAGADGLFYGNPGQLVTQLIGVGASWVFAIVATYIIIKVLGMVMQLRAAPDQEVQGLDITEHGERGYAYQDFLAGSPVSHSGPHSLQPSGLTKVSLNS